MTSTRRRRLFIGGCVIAVLIVLTATSFWSSLQGVGQTFLVPSARFLNRLALAFGSLVRSPELRRENESLRRQVAELEARAVEQGVLTLENEALRKLALVPKSPSFKALGVEVIGRQEDDSGTAYLIDRGRSDGLVPGLAVVAGLPQTSDKPASPLALLVGTVRTVGEHAATFVVTTANQSQVLAQALSPTRPQGLAVGEYNLAVRLRYISLTELLSAGTPVVTSNLSALLPPNLLIGTVTALEKSEGEFFQSAIVSPPAPLDRFQFLTVLLAP